MKRLFNGNASQWGGVWGSIWLLQPIEPALFFVRFGEVPLHVAAQHHVVARSQAGALGAGTVHDSFTAFRLETDGELGRDSGLGVAEGFALWGVQDLTLDFVAHEHGLGGVDSAQDRERDYRGDDEAGDDAHAVLLGAVMVTVQVIVHGSSFGMTTE